MDKTKLLKTLIEALHTMPDELGADEGSDEGHESSDEPKLDVEILDIAKPDEKKNEEAPSDEAGEESDEQDSGDEDSEKSEDTDSEEEAQESDDEEDPWRNNPFLRQRRK